jgi:imidazolonepropionase-like amidohydrolase
MRQLLLLLLLFLTESIFNGATVPGMEKTIGAIEKGKSADLLIIDGDPSKNISDYRKVMYVFKKGVGFNAKRMFDSMKEKVGVY